MPKSNDFQILIEWMYLPSFRWIDKIPFKLSSGQASPSKKRHFWSCDLSDWLKCHCSIFKKNSPRLLPKPAKFEKNPPNGYRVIRKTKCGAGRDWRSPIYKQASRKGRLINFKKVTMVRNKVSSHLPHLCLLASVHVLVTVNLCNQWICEFPEHF